MAEDSVDRWNYEARIAKRFGFEQQLELPIPLPRLHNKKRPPTEAIMQPETHQSLKQSAIILGLIFAGVIIVWVLVAGLGLL